MPPFLQNFQRIVIKIGSALLVDPENGLRESWLDSLLEDAAKLVEAGHELIVVSSGAIALGRTELQKLGTDLGTRPLKLEESQAAAAVGQIVLSQLWSQTLQAHGLAAAQILLTIGDTEVRRHYLNARNTISTALQWGVIPVINENDTVATSEIRFGDNDRLAARVATMVGADLLVLFSDVDGLYDSPPSENPAAKLIPRVTSIDEKIESMAGGAASVHSRGGMRTKIEAGRIATASGTAMVIANGTANHPISRLNETGTGTWFDPNANAIRDRKKWISGVLEISGEITIDAGAIVALERGKSLLSAGVTAVSGIFSRGDTVLVKGPNGHSVARGLVEYDSDVVAEIKGLKTHEISERLGKDARSTLVHRDNLVMDE